MRHRSGYVLALLGILAVPAMAQTRDDASITDARVRITMASREQLTGTVVALRADTVVVRLSSTGSNRELARSEIAHIERSAGTRGYRLRGAALGFLVGAAAGAGIGAATAKEPPPCTGSLCFNGLEESMNTLGGGLVGALVGTTAGVLIGGRRREQWRPVADGVRVGIGPASGKRVALSVSLRRW
jgi:hypothetical protein